MLFLLCKITQYLRPAAGLPLELPRLCDLSLMLTCSSLVHGTSSLSRLQSLDLTNANNTLNWTPWTTRHEELPTPWSSKPPDINQTKKHRKGAPRWWGGGRSEGWEYLRKKLHSLHSGHILWPFCCTGCTSLNWPNWIDLTVFLLGVTSPTRFLCVFYSPFSLSFLHLSLLSLLLYLLVDL